MKKVITRGLKAFQSDLTCSEFQGFLFWGMVELPTWVEVNISRSSLISDRCRCRRSSARLAITPKAVFSSKRRRSRYSGSTIWVECSEGVRPRKAR